MKRWISTLLAVLMCLSLMPAITAESQTSIPLGQDQYDWWLTDMDEGEFGCEMTNGVQSIHFCYTKQNWEDSFNNHSHRAPAVEGRILAPEGAVAYKEIESVESFDKEALLNATNWKDLEEAGDDRWATRTQRYEVCEITDDDLLSTKEHEDTRLIVWKDESGNLIDLGHGQYINSFTIRITHETSLSNEPITRIYPSVLPAEDFGWWLNDIIDGSFGCDSAPGQQWYAFDYSLQDWADSYNRRHQPPVVEGVIIAPENAVAYRFIPTEDNFDPQAALASNAWQAFKDATDPVIRLSYNVCEITEDGKLTSLEYDETLLIVWKDENGNLIDLGHEQYINSFTMTIEHKNDFVDEQLDVIDIAMVPYCREDEPQVWNIYFEEPVVPDSLTHELKDGVCSLNVGFTQQEYQDILASRTSGSQELWMNVNLPAPEGAVMINTYKSATFDAAAYEYVLNDQFFYFEGEPYMLGTSVTYAQVHRYDSTVIIEPQNSERWIFAAWKDENGNLINVGTEENPSYVEYLKLELTHASMEDVTFTDPSVIADDAIRANATGWEDAAFGGKDADVAASEVVYYILRGKLIELYEQDPALYAELVTQVTAPENAVRYRLSDEQQPIDIPDSGCIDLSHAMIRENNGQTEFIDGYWVDQYTITWLDKSGEILSTQRLAVTMIFTAETTWMDRYYSPAAKDRIGSTQDNTDVAIVSDKDGVAKNRFNVDLPKNDQLTLTITAPDDDRIVAYRTTTKDTPYVYQNYPWYDSIYVDVRDQLDHAEIIPLTENRFAAFEDRASFLTKDVPVDRYGKNFINTIYLHETYGNNIEDTQVCFVEWLDENGNVLLSEYVYHELERLDQQATDGLYKILTENADYRLIVHLYRQHVQGNKENQGAYYVQMWVEDENGKRVQPTTKLNIRIPYPEGSDENCDFIIEHFEDESHLNFTLEKFEKKKDGIYLTLDHFSPFLFSWEKTEDEPEDDPPQQDDSDDTIFHPDYTEPETEPLPAASAYRVTCRKLNVRSGAGTEFPRIDQLRRGETVTGTALENGWIRITLEDGRIGYVCGTYVQAEVPPADPVPKAGTVICRKLNVRNGSGTQYARIGQIARGTTVDIIGQDATCTWYMIRWEDRTTWVCAKYIEPNN